MDIPKIPESEYRFCLLVWEREPVTAVELVKLSQAELGWKKSTTYTVIKRLGDRGILKLENGVVSALVSREEAEAAEAESFMASKFGGSLPAFVAAFTKRRHLSDSDLDEVQRMIDQIRKGGEAI